MAATKISRDDFKKQVESGKNSDCTIQWDLVSNQDK